ncbi:hypothetical protein [Helicobacter sp. MIT 01-3238]|uniref:hypothetical protein n=1 Tax=Helicobacter sp. MIT 01-3238 TaxID=398627 RepID=UPI0015F19EB7|nr:hypothetical protein [Helicobacter sp. MIT 01-3238]
MRDYAQKPIIVANRISVIASERSERGNLFFDSHNNEKSPSQNPITLKQRA